MNKHDCYVVDGCVDFIPVKRSTLTSSGVEVTIVGSAQKETVLVDKVYQMPKLFEPQKVVVPKFVAEWIEELKKNHSNLAWVWQVYPNEPKVKNWLEANTEKFMRAWLDGFEIEQEKLYTVEIADAILTKITRGCERNVKYRMLPYKEIHNVFNDGIYTNFLTETEIKQADERLWQFAKEVEE